MKYLLAAITMVLMAGAASSQGTAAADKGQAATPAPVAQQPLGPRGPGARGRMMRFNDNNTPGWSMMTPEERRVHRAKMQGFKTVDECRAYADEHRKLMDQRAQERGIAPRAAGNGPCNMMQRRGWLRQ